ncbi:hypothetical protein CI109_102511 [Kwoniella shandongensis]|uniref:Uncharacterized protein n=1 Tax=Kwoniella shandongensis TaxID=1734106 RepID=A0A5M6BZU2_9TREE|nr:uncharacterized protein CI109_003171 [Kwoniella shandongensis]KAA5528273.1 hypothetical protein CI109_003171 [Kwoniella shandongensis]
MLLKRIADSLPPSLAALVPELESVGIRTTESLIFTPPATIFDLLPSFSQTQLDTLTSHILNLTAPSCVKGDEIEAEEGAWKGFGVGGLDDLLEEVEGGIVLEIAGPRKVGKSLLALHAALRILLSDPEAICRWIDTEGSFAPERARAILESWGAEDPKIVLARMVVIPCFRLEGVFDAVAELKESLLRVDGDSQTRVLVVDTIFTHFKDLLMNTSAQGHADLITLMEEISEITYSAGLTSIIINSTASSQPTNPQSAFNKVDIKPALGTSFTYCTDMTLLVQETGRVFGMMDEEERERIRMHPGLRGLVEVIRSRVTATGRWAVFETDGTRLYDVLPPHEVDERTTRISAGLPTGPARPIHGSLAQTLRP